MKAIETRNHQHRAETYLKAYQRSKPEDETQLRRLRGLVGHYQRLNKKVPSLNQAGIYQAAA